MTASVTAPSGVTALSGVAALSSRAVLLRPLLPSDGDWCYTLMCGPAGERWRYRGRTPSPEVVAHDLWRGVFAQFVVVERSTGRPAGIVGFYNTSPEAARAHAFAIAEPDLAPLVTEGFGLLMAWGFDHHGFDRIFIETAEFNAANFESLGRAAVVEGRLRNYDVWRGRFWDLLILSVTAEAFASCFGELLAARRAAEPALAMSAAQFTDLVAELWPLDSLGAVEVLTALEEVVGAPLSSDVLHRLPDAADAAAVVLLHRSGGELVDETGAAATAVGEPGAAFAPAG